MEDFSNDQFYPPKPILEEKIETNSWLKTIVSILLFIITFLLVFDEKITFILILVASLFIHELGHFLFMKLFRYQQVRMLFVPLMGAFVQGKKKKYSQFESLLVVAGGPFPGIFIGSAFAVLFQYSHESIYFFISIIFIALNIINLLPLDPLDGGQLFKLLLKKNSDLFLLIFSLTSSLILIALGLFLDNWFLIAFGFFMGFRVRSLQRNYYIRKELVQLGIQYQIDYSDLTNKDYAQIKEVLLEHSKILQKYKDIDETEESEKFIAEQVNGILVAPVERDASFWLKGLVVLLWILCFVVPVIVLLQIDTHLINYEILFR